MQENDVLQKLPKHLHNLIIDQPYNQYTAKDHAVWRYVMRQNVVFFTKMAHGDYIKGLEQTGVSINEIPKMYGMNRILKDIGWSAAAVDGFIPPQAFMEFQAYKVLVIAADIRTANHIEYTPAPDILHEAAGHAPIIADPEYALYLEKFGKIGAKAFSSANDYASYEAIRHLSIIKEYPDTLPEEIEQAEKEIADLEANNTYTSEMSRLRNLHWWTVEYGLIGTTDDFKIYGAGLLSSIQESQQVVTDKVKKLPYTIKAADVGFDITTMQPQLFVTPSFEYLNKVLDDFASTLASKTGGKKAYEKAVISESVATVEFENGLQISGVFSQEIFNEHGIDFIKTNTPTQISSKGKELSGHNKEYHQHGYSMPLGQWLGVNKTVSKLSKEDVAELNLQEGKVFQINYSANYSIEGKIERLTYSNNYLALIQFSECWVKYNNTVLFHPDWGNFDLVVATQIVSCFPGPADPIAFDWSFEAPKETTKKIIHTAAQQELYSKYQYVKSWRDEDLSVSNSELASFSKDVVLKYPQEWLLLLETAELLVSKLGMEPAQDLIVQLQVIAASDASKSKLIRDGIRLLEK